MDKKIFENLSFSRHQSNILLKTYTAKLALILFSFILGILLLVITETTRQ